MSRLIYVGIDPGVSGGMAIIWPDGRVDATKWTTASDMADRLWALEDPEYQARATIERVSSSPQQGVRSAFTFGENYGIWTGILAGIGAPFERVTPSKWQRALGVPPKKKTESQADHKRKLKRLAQELFPQVKVTGATQDALLIAEYARRLEARG